MNNFTIPRNWLVWEWLLDWNANDTSWSWYNWTATNVTYAKTTKGYQSQAGSFNGSSSISITGNQVNSTSRSYSVWVKLNWYSNYWGIVLYDYVSSNNFEWIATLWTSGGLRLKEWWYDTVINTGVLAFHNQGLVGRYLNQ